ncbi:MAG: hypothetical protein AAB787_00640 [Patescibacteria group bacterium]
MTKNWCTLVSQFRNQTLPKSEWTHEAHLVVALWHLLEYKNISNTLCYLRSGIILYNHSVGTQNTASSGYHETITVFWVKQLHEFVQSEGLQDFSILVARLLNTPLVQKDYILQFYRKEVLKSEEARGLYVAPT